MEITNLAWHENIQSGVHPSTSRNVNPIWAFSNDCSSGGSAFLAAFRWSWVAFASALTFSSTSRAFSLPAQRLCQYVHVTGVYVYSHVNLWDVVEYVKPTKQTRFDFCVMCASYVWIYVCINTGIWKGRQLTTADPFVSAVLECVWVCGVMFDCRVRATHHKYQMWPLCVCVYVWYWTPMCVPHIMSLRKALITTFETIIQDHVTLNVDIDISAFRWKPPLLRQCDLWSSSDRCRVTRHSDGHSNWQQRPPSLRLSPSWHSPPLCTPTWFNDIHEGGTHNFKIITNLKYDIRPTQRWSELWAACGILKICKS